MYKNEFDKLLKSKIPQASFFYGECEFLIDFYGKKITQQITQNGGVEVYKIYFDGYNAESIRDIFATQSLFATSSLVILKLDSAKFGSKKSSDEIESFLKLLKQNEQNYLIFELHNSGDVAKYNQVGKALSAVFGKYGGAAVRFFNLRQNEALEILAQKARDLGLKINNANLLHLYNIQNQQIGLCVNELGKFVVFEREISKGDIDNLCYGLYTNSIEELCESLLNKKNYITIAAKLEEEGIQEAELVAFMQFYFYRLFLFFAFIKSNGSSNSSAILGYTLPRDIEEKYARFAIKLRNSQYLEIFKTLNLWLVAARSGKSKNIFENLIKLQATIK